MRIQTETPMTYEAARYILKANGWNHREGMNGMEYITSLREDAFGNVIEYNSQTEQIAINRDVHTQELLAALKVFRII